jgi:hypothetical protein
MRTLFLKLVTGLLTMVIVVVAVTVGAVAATSRVRHGEWRVPSKEDVRELVKKVIVREPEPSRVIVLQRDALQVIGGRDDARAHRSSLVEPGVSVTVPRYRASNATWRRLKRCVAQKFEAYDVVVSDEIPDSGDYVLVKVGGRPADIGMAGKPLGGIAPFNGHAIPNSIVFAFDQRGKYRTKNNCETVAHEVGHVFGLDHTMTCKDLMSYEHDCGAKRFVDAEMKCGEHEDRACEDRTPIQNSAAQLMSTLGPSRENELESSR